MTWSRSWAVACSLTAVLTVAAVLGGLAGPGRVVLVFCFLLVCPGMAFVGLLGLGSRLLQLIAGVALSLLLGVVVAQILIYTGWRPVLGIVALACVTLVGSAVSYRYDVPGGAGARRAISEGS
ncbi:MAG TPA: hypothetical protein VFR87_15930 [Nocardioidaceae bacterium]|nr:hypothetical protein [Nocardioidaceae bacterium]